MDCYPEHARRRAMRPAVYVDGAASGPAAEMTACWPGEIVRCRGQPGRRGRRRSAADTSPGTKNLITGFISIYSPAAPNDRRSNQKLRADHRNPAVLALNERKFPD